MQNFDQDGAFTSSVEQECIVLTSSGETGSTCSAYSFYVRREVLHQVSALL